MDKRHSDEYKRSWINSRFQLLDKAGNPLPAVYIPFKNVTIPVSQAILEDTGIECAQVRGTASSAEYEEAFLESKEWDKQFPGVVTVVVTPQVVAIHKKIFAGKRRDDVAASAKFRQTIGIMVAEDPTQFEYAVTDGAHRTKLGKVHFSPQVTVMFPLSTHQVFAL